VAGLTISILDSLILDYLDCSIARFGQRLWAMARLSFVGSSKSILAGWWEAFLSGLWGDFSPEPKYSPFDFPKVYKPKRRPGSLEGATVRKGEEELPG